MPAPRRSGRCRVAVLHLPGVVHDVLGGASHEELKRPRPGRPALGVVGADGIEIGPSMRRQAVLGEDDLARRADLDLPRELLGLGGVHVADGLAWLRPALRAPGRSWGRHRAAASSKSPPAPAGGQGGARGRRRPAPRARSPTAWWAMPQKSVELRARHAFHHLHVAGARDRNLQPGPLRDPGVARHVRQQPVEGVVLRRPPAIEAGPIRGAGHDPAFLAVSRITRSVWAWRQATARRCLREDLAKRRGEAVRVARLPVLVAHEAAVTAREPHRRHAESVGRRRMRRGTPSGPPTPRPHRTRSAWRLTARPRSRARSGCS